jgi:1-phosphofructokinase family hexose kinase
VILGVPRLRAGEVHRATDGHRRVGGKGVNVARACGRMGVPVRLVALADERGAQELAGEPDLVGCTQVVVRLEGDARTDVIAAEASGRATVINGIGDPVPATAVEHGVELLLADVMRGDLVVLTGSLPRGVPVGLYGGIVGEVRARGARTIVDASGPWLQASLERGPDIVKLNVAELADVIGADRAACWRHGGPLVPGVGALVLTAAARGARLWADGHRTSIRAPRRTVVNGVGAGDAMTAGLAVGLDHGGTLIEAVAQGAAWGAAAVGELDLTFDPRVARALEREVLVSRRPGD